MPPPSDSAAPAAAHTGGLEALVDAVPVGLGTLDADLRYVRVNPALAALHGVPAQDHLGRRTSELHPALGAVVEPLLAGVVATGAAVENAEVRVAPRGAPGDLRDALWTVIPDLGPDGAVRGVHLAVRVVTTRARAETASDLDFALDAVGVGAFSRDLATDVVELDSRARAVLGIGHDLPIEKALERVHPDDMPALMPVLAPVEAGLASSFGIALRVRDDDGAWRWVEFRARRIDDRGAAGVITGVVFDTTALHTAEADRAQARDDLDFVLASVGVGVWSLDLATEAYRLDDRARAVTRLSPPLDVAEAMSRVHPDDVEAIRAQLGAATADGGDPDVAFAARLRGDDGVVRWIEVRGRFHPDQGAAGTLSGVVHDTTALRRATEQARRRLSEIESYFRSIPLVVSVIDRDGRLLRVNDQFAVFAGRPTEALIGESASALFPALADMTEPLIAEVLATGKPRLGVPVQAAPPSAPDDPRHWLLYVHPVVVDGDVVAVTVGSQDVTDLTAARNDLRALTAELEARVAERTRQVRGLAVELTQAEEAERERIGLLLHDDLQQTLFGVQVQTLLLAPLLGDGTEAAALLALARDLLAEAIDTARTLSVEFSPSLDPGAAFEESLAWLAHRVESTYGVRVAVDAPDDLSVAPGLRAVLLRSLRELLFNVVKHAGVEATDLAVAVDGGAIRVEVSDAGAGFDPARVSDGVGLDSVRRRIGLVGGSLTLDSAPGRGTRAVLTAPLSAPA